MWQKQREREREHVEEKSRHPLFDPNKQGKEGDAKLQEKPPGKETRNINPVALPLDLFNIIEPHQNKKRQRDEVSPQKFVTKYCVKR